MGSKSSSRTVLLLHFLVYQDWIQEGNPHLLSFHIAQVVCFVRVIFLCSDHLQPVVTDSPIKSEVTATSRP